MCGRYTAAKDFSELIKLVGVIMTRAPFLTPRYNIAPTQLAPVIYMERHQPAMKLMRWGLIPSWAKDASVGSANINARSETITEKSSFRKPFQSQRCLIPADGFYEWQSTQNGKQPFRFTRKDGGFFCMAGLWDKWIRPPRSGELNLGDGNEPDASQVVETFTVITTTPNAMVARVHDRMPVILSPEHYGWWLEPKRFEPDFLKTLLRPYPAEEMDCHSVSKLVNSAKNDSPECLKPV